MSKKRSLEISPDRMSLPDLSDQLKYVNQSFWWITSLKTNTLENDLIERHFSMFDEIASKTVHNLDDHDR